MFPAEVFARGVSEFSSHLRMTRGSQPSDYELMDFINTDIITRYDEDIGELTAPELRKLMLAEENADAVAELELIREDFYLKQMASDPKSSTGCIFALKQPKNGGYSDKQEVSTEKVLRIKLEGVGANAGK